MVAISSQKLHSNFYGKIREALVSVSSILYRLFLSPFQTYSPSQCLQAFFRTCMSLFYRGASVMQTRKFKLFSVRWVTAAAAGHGRYRGIATFLGIADPSIVFAMVDNPQSVSFRSEFQLFLLSGG